MYFVVEALPRSGRDEDAGRSFVLRYRFDGAPVRFRLGAFPEMGVADARKAAKEALLIWGGPRPRTIRREAVASDVAAKKAADEEAKNTVEAAWVEFDERHLVPKCRAGTRARYKQDASNWLPKIGARPLRDVTKRDVLAMIDIAQARGPSAANTCLTVLSSFFAWCVDRCLLDKSPAEGVKKPNEYTPVTASWTTMKSPSSGRAVKTWAEASGPCSVAFC